MDLGQHEEISEGANAVSKSDDKNDESNEIVATSSCAFPATSLEGDDGSDKTTSTSARNTKSHDHGETKLTEEDEEKYHEVEAGV